MIEKIAKDRYQFWRSQLHSGQEVLNYVEQRENSREPLQGYILTPMIADRITAAVQKEIHKLFK